MKKHFLIIVLIVFCATGHSQILLDEARVEYQPFSMKVDPITKSVELEIPEEINGEFQKDPLTFIKNHFNIQSFIQQNKKYKFNEYEVSFRSTKGKLTARYNKDGELISTQQKFKNVALPVAAHLEIMKQYKGGVVLSNTYVASSKAWDISKEIYRVKLKDGDRTRRLKFNKSSDALYLVGM